MPLVVCRVSPGRKIVVLFWTKYAAPRQIKPGVLELDINRSQSNSKIVFIFVSCEKKTINVSFRYDSSGAQSPYARIVEDASINVAEAALDSTTTAMRAKKLRGKDTIKYNHYLEIEN